MLAGLTLAGPPVAANPSPADFSTVDSMKAYLESKGVSTAAAIVQEGVNNYVGPACPGIDWTCADPVEGAPVIQRTTTGENRAEISGDTLCAVVQTAETGPNSATCDYTGETPVDLRAVVGQQNLSSTNTSDVTQDVSASGDSSTVTQSADVHQQITTGGTGSNSSVIDQSISQFSSAGGPVTQEQLSDQELSLDQFSDSGNNDSTADQHLEQDMLATGSGIVQHQNSTGEVQYQRSRVNQVSNTGTNTHTLNGTTDQYASAVPFECCYEAAPPEGGEQAAEAEIPPPSVQQHQGCESCGILGSIDQSSAGVSTATATLTELQEVSAIGIEDAEQVQVGPVAVPGADTVNFSPVNGVRCCSDQLGNGANSFTINIDSTQLGGSAAVQDNYVNARCHTSGSCNAGLSINQNGATVTEECAGTDCNIAIQCFEGQACRQTGTTPPDTFITSGPPSITTGGEATFSFTSTEPAAYFICALDEGDWEQCSSPVTYTGLGGGYHLFRVSGVDIAGNPDQTPAVLNWVIDTFIETTIDEAPSTYTNQTTAKLKFHGSEEAVSFECSLDGGTWTACTSPKSYSGLAAGKHTFRVRALDALGQADPSPDTAVWIIDLGRPTSHFTTNNLAIRIGTPFGNGTVDGKAFDDVAGIERVELQFKAGGVLTRTVNATLECNALRTKCDFRRVVFGLPPGLYLVSQQAFDRAGNAGTATEIMLVVI